MVFNFTAPLIRSKNLFVRYYDEEVYKHLENLYNHSQYRLKNPTSIIADEIVFRYAAGAYLRGVDPILINSETAPLGKYFVALSIYYFANDSIIIIFFALLSLILVWFLGFNIFHDKILGLVPAAIFSFDKLFINQILITPLMDIIQLPFILLAIIFFIVELQKKHFILTALTLGIVMSVKSIIPALLLIITFLVFLLITRKINKMIKLIIMLPLSILILMLVYLRTFQSGYGIYDFFRFQKWILFYQQSKLVHPLSFWNLILFNRWQAWWGEAKIMSANDWALWWPIATLLPLVSLPLIYIKRIKLPDSVSVLLLWVIVYEAFLSIGIVSTRFFLPLLPFLYILGIYFVKMFIKTKFIKHNNYKLYV